MATYVVVEMLDILDKNVPYGVDMEWHLCKTMFSDLESAKKSAEKELSHMQGGRWRREEWAEARGSHWWRHGETDEAAVQFDIYKLASNDGEADIYTYIGGAAYYE